MVIVKVLLIGAFLIAVIGGGMCLYSSLMIMIRKEESQRELRIMLDMLEQYKS
jgi:hypothetical protein